MPLRDNVHVVSTELPGYGPKLRKEHPFNTELPVSNRLLAYAEIEKKQTLHRQRREEIAARPPSCTTVGNAWNRGAQPEYTHLSHNLKRIHMAKERAWTIARENKMLLDKMTAQRVVSGDPTEGTWEFSPGVRLNRFQMPLIDHGISHRPTMPQRGAATLAESLNCGARRRELERITRENRGIVARLQQRRSSFARAQWQRRSDDHDRYLSLIARPQTAQSAGRLLTPQEAARQERNARRPGSRGARSGGARRQKAYIRPAESALLRRTAEGAIDLLIGLASFYEPGCTVWIQPGEEAEECVTVASVWLRRDGLVLLLSAPCRISHPAGSLVRLELTDERRRELEAERSSSRGSSEQPGAAAPGGAAAAGPARGDEGGAQGAVGEGAAAEAADADAAGVGAEPEEPEGELQREELLVDVFSELDDDGSGTLSFTEFMQLAEIKETAAMSELLSVFKATDKTGSADSRVTMDEFIQFNMTAFASLTDAEFKAQAAHWLELAESQVVIDDETVADEGVPS
jgi:hypothetical protein